jgi:REP-associated tyrosine transposase
MLVQEIAPAMGDALVNLFEQHNCPASPLAALLPSGYTTLRSAEFRLRILVDSWVLNLSALNLSAIREPRNRPMIWIRRCWKGILWSPSYFAASRGGAPINILETYIELQKTPL